MNWTKVNPRTPVKYDMFVWPVILGLLWAVVGAQRFVDVEEEIQYEDPKYPLRGFDLKISSLKSGLSGGKFDEVSIISAAAVCQVNYINQGRTNIQLDGKLRIAFQEYNKDVQTSQNAYVSMLKGNLTNATTKQSLNPEFDKTSVFFGSDGQGNARLDSAISGGYSLPFLSTASLAQTGLINNIIYRNDAINQTYFQFRLASNTSILEALVPFLKSMNWTLVGTVYESTIFGYVSEELTQIYQIRNSEPLFACKTFAGKSGSGSFSIEERSISQFCKCIRNSYDKINVVVLFAELNSAYNLASLIEEVCGNPGYTYVVTVEVLLTPRKIMAEPSPLTNSFLIRTFFDWDIQSYLKTCYEIVDKPDSDFVRQSMRDFFYTKLKCIFSIDETDSLPPCPENIEDRTFDCACSISDASLDQTVLPELFFTVDSISAIGYALSLLQNNCTYLNEKSETYAPNVPIQDFCALTYFTPGILNYALRIVNFTGYTGQISFASSSRSRLNQKYFFYQIKDRLNDLTYLGKFNFAGLQINSSAIVFPNGTPISRIIYDNPSLSNAAVAVFFGISVVIVAAFSVAAVLLILNYNNRVLRIRSPIVTIIMCIGILLGAIGWLLMSLGATDALCWITLLIDNVGFAFLLGGLIAKNFRIYRIFSNNRGEAVDISTGRLCSFIGLLTLFFLLMTLFMLLNGYGAIVIISSDNPFYIYVSCKTPSSFWNTFYSILSVTSKVLVLLVACWLSWLTRKVRNAYNESKELAIISYSFLMSYILLLPIYYILNDTTDSETLKYVVRVEQLLIVELLGLFVYFIPLLNRMFTNQRQ